MEKKVYILITGGSLSEEFIRGYILDRPYLKNAGVICIDRGLNHARSLGLIPDIIVGDFDSVDKNELKWWRENEKKFSNLADARRNASHSAKFEKNPRFISLCPEKDLTDTHTAVLEAIRLKAEKILIFGATGGRQDHFLANLNILMLPMREGIKAYILDEQNRISLVEHGFTIKRKESYGKYISFIPFIGPVTNVTMRGFKYETEGITLNLGESLGISNEISEENASIDFDSGVLIVAESKDSFY